jgi:hypothetical protein
LQNGFVEFGHNNLIKVEIGRKRTTTWRRILAPNERLAVFENYSLWSHTPGSQRSLHNRSTLRFKAVTQFASQFRYAPIKDSICWLPI